MPPAKPRSDYIETDTGNKVARKAQLHGTQHIILGGRTVIQPEVCIRGDLVRSAPAPVPAAAAAPSTSTAAAAATSTSTTTSKDTKPAPSTSSSGGGTSVSIGRYTFIARGAILRPPHRLYKGTISFHPLKIGEHVFVGENAIVEAASVGDHVHVGRGAVLGRMAIVKDRVKVLEGAVVPPGMVVASGVVVGGRPARVLGELGDGWGVEEGAEGGDLRELWRSVG